MVTVLLNLDHLFDLGSAEAIPVHFFDQFRVHNSVDADALSDADHFGQRHFKEGH